MFLPTPDWTSWFWRCATRHWANPSSSPYAPEFYWCWRTRISDTWFACLLVSFGHLFLYWVPSKKLIILINSVGTIFMISLAIFESRVSNSIWCLSNTNPEWSNCPVLAAKSISVNHLRINGRWVDLDITSLRKETFQELNFDACGQGTNSNLSGFCPFRSTFIGNWSRVRQGSKSRWNMLPWTAFCGSRCLKWWIDSFCRRKGLRTICAWWWWRNRWVLQTVFSCYTLRALLRHPSFVSLFTSFFQESQAVVACDISCWGPVASSCALMTACFSLFWSFLETLLHRCHLSI